MSNAQILWENWNRYDGLDRIYRQGFLKAEVYGYGIEARSMIDRYHTESVLSHSGRAAMLLSDMMDLWPSYFKDVDKYLVLKTMLNHDIGELLVGDICDDGRKEHDEKKELEWVAVVEHYSGMPEQIYLSCKKIHREFEESQTFLGQSLKLADKLDFVAKLIKLEGQGYDFNNRRILSTNDRKLAKEINTYSFVDIVANHLRHMMLEQQFDQRLVQIAIQFLTYGLRSANRPFFEWWETN